MSWHADTLLESANVWMGMVGWQSEHMPFETILIYSVEVNV